MAMMAVALMATSCASKKDLQNCQTENRGIVSQLSGYQGKTGSYRG